ncbi:MAG: NAD-dependent epimerase/dehydratase family protein [Acidobacteriota bacterium]
MRVFLTGGTGFLGKRIAERLVRAGHQVRALVRPGRGDRRMPKGVEPVTGDVVDRDSLARGAEGAEVIFHIAALVKMWAPDRRRFDDVNIGGLRNILEVARRTGVRRLLYTSSFIALGPTDGRVADETWVHPPERYHNDYERTKAAADLVARAAAAEGAPIVILYPGVIYGAGEMTGGSLMTKTIRDFMRRRVPYLGSGDQTICYAFIDDVVEGHMEALARGQLGRGYILGGENVDFHRLFTLLSKLTGIPAPRLHVPFRVMELAGRLLRWRADLTGAEPALTDQVVRIYRHDWAYSSQRACREIGYRITPLEEGLRRTVQWLRSRPA